MSDAHPTMRRCNFFLPRQIIDALRAKSDKTGQSMSELIRQALVRYLGLDRHNDTAG